MAHAIDLIRSVEQLKDEIPLIRIGDTVKVSVKIVEGNRERVQAFQGIVIAKASSGINESITVRRIAAHGIGVERKFLVHSPRIADINVIRHAKIRRAKLYYLRGRTGKSARLKEKRFA